MCVTNRHLEHLHTHAMYEDMANIATPFSTSVLTFCVLRLPECTRPTRWLRTQSCPHTFWGIETSITSLADILEDSEHLAISILPLPYAQLTRFLTLLFLMVLPMAYILAIGWGVVPLSFFVNLIYFLMDECAGQMEEPFGDDPNDIAMEKTIRRIDKLGAAQLYQYFKTPVTNFNLFPEARSTDASGNIVAKVRSTGHGAKGTQSASFVEIADSARSSRRASVQSPSASTRSAGDLSPSMDTTRTVQRQVISVDPAQVKLPKEVEVTEVPTATA